MYLNTYLSISIDLACYFCIFPSIYTLFTYLYLSISGIFSTFMKNHTTWLFPASLSLSPSLLTGHERFIFSAALFSDSNSARGSIGRVKNLGGPD